MKKNLLYSILTVITTLVLYLCLYPVPFDPVEYDYPSNPGFTGPYEKNNELSTANQLLMGIGKGPEDITIGPDSFFYTGFEDGRIVRFTQEGKLLETIVNTGGRPLGIQFDKNDNLIVADAYKGLISISLQGDVQVLADSVDGTEIYYADDLDIGKDGTIWFSDATQRHHENILLDYMGLQATGRLLSYNPRTKKTKVELSGLRFANGVALGPNEDYILVTETIVEVNDKICEMSGFERDELVGESARIFYATSKDFEKLQAETTRQVAEKGQCLSSRTI